MKRLIDHDPFTGTWTWHDYDPVTDETTIITEFDDVSGHLDANKALANEGNFKGKFWWRAASIPNAVIHKWLVEEGIDLFNKDHLPAVKRKLNDPEYRYLRTGHFRL